jgi:hypothetical protein
MKTWVSPLSASVIGVYPYDRVLDAVFRERIYSDADRHHEKRAAAKHCLENFRAGLPIWVVFGKREGSGNASGGGSVQDHRRRSA